MAKLEAIGTYRGKIKESVFKLSKGGFPQFVMKLAADEKFVESDVDLAYFVAQGTIAEAVPQWVNWEAFEEEIMSFMVLYGNKDKTGEFNKANATLSISQIQTALGWDGSSFAPLQDDTYTGSQVQFRVSENNNPEFTNKQVSWLNKFDADPSRSLTGVDASEISSLDAKLARGMGFKKGVKVAAPTSPKPVVPKAGPTSTITLAPTGQLPPKESTSTSDPTSAPVQVGSIPPSTSPEETAQSVWDYIVTNSNEAEVENEGSFKSAINEIMQDTEKAEDAFDSGDWFKVKKAACADLGVLVHA